MDTKINGAKDMMENCIEPQLQKYLSAYVVTGEYHGTSQSINIRATHRPALLTRPDPEELTNQFKEHLLSKGVMRKDWNCFCTEAYHPALLHLKKLNPMLQEVMSRYTIIGRTHDYNSIVIKSGCDGFYALHLLVQGYYNRNQPTAS